MTRLPRLRAAVVAGSGAGGSLGAAALCILALVTVSFIGKGAPQLREPGATVRLADPPADRAPQPAARRVQATEPASAPATATRVAERRRRRAATRRRRAVETEQRASRPVVRAAPQLPASPAPAPAPPAAPPEPTLVRGHVEDAAGQVRRAGEAAAGTASQVSPKAGEAIRQTTGAAADVADGVAALLP